MEKNKLKGERIPLGGLKTERGPQKAGGPLLLDLTFPLWGERGKILEGRSRPKPFEKVA
jgi:hypothetical protein